MAGGDARRAPPSWTPSSATGPPIWPASTCIRRRRRRRCDGSRPGCRRPRRLRPAAPADGRRAPPGPRAPPATGSPPSSAPRARTAALDAAAAHGHRRRPRMRRARHRRPRRLARTARHSATASRSSATGARRSPRGAGRERCIETTGARGLAGDLFVDGALGSRTAWLHEPYTDAPDRCGNSYLDADAITAHLRACTEAGITAGFHVIGDAAVGAVVDALQRVVDRFGARRRRTLRPPPRAPRDGDRRAGGPSSARGASSPACSPTSTRCGAARTGCTRSGSAADRALRLNPFALLASQGVPLAFGSDTPGDQHESVGDSPCRGAGTTPRPARSRRGRRSLRRPAAPGARAGCATASPARWCPARRPPTRSGTPANWSSAPPTDAVQRWSTDPRSRVPALPRLGADDRLPRCLATVHRGVVIHG